MKVMDQKGRGWRVVKRFCRRGGLWPPDSKALVVRPPRSCLGDNGDVGRIVGGIGYGKWEKGGFLIKKGGIWLSSSMGPQSNDRC